MAHDPNCKCCTDGRDAFLADIEARIQVHGFVVIATATETAKGDLSMAYTIGLSDEGLPELILFGIPQRSAHVLLNEAANMLRQGKLPVDVPLTELASMPTYMREVTPEAAAPYIIQANERAGRTLPALQLVWPDPAGRFPWDPDMDAKFADIQPRLYVGAPRVIH